MTSPLRKFKWWVHRRRKEAELREELQFHLANEADERQAEGLTEDEARWAASRDLGNVTRLREDTRTLWTWTSLEQLAQDLRYAVRMMFRNRAVTALAVLEGTVAPGVHFAADVLDPVWTAEKLRGVDAVTELRTFEAGPDSRDVEEGAI